jgi:hypothetical protein
MDFKTVLLYTPKLKYFQLKNNYGDLLLNKNYFLLILVIPFTIYAQTVTTQVNFAENISCNTYQKNYNVKVILLC